jgi:hypothetical protein
MTFPYREPRTALVLIALSALAACGKTRSYDDGNSGGFAGSPEGGEGGEGGAPGTGGTPDSVCVGEGFDHDEDATTGCRPWTECTAGEYVKVEGSSSADRKCAECESGTFSMTENATACDDLTVCPAGTYTERPGSRDRDAGCAACPDETFSSEAGASACTPWNTCSTSFWLSAKGTATADAVCDGTTWQFGSSAYDTNAALTVGADGSVYVVGWTPGALPGQTSAGSYDAFVKKYDATGEEAWTRQFGTTGADQAYGVAVDANDNVFVVGSVAVALPGQAAVGGQDAFLRRYDSAGTELWTRQFGTTSDDSAKAVDVDSEGSAFVVGSTYGTMGITSLGGADAFVRRYSPTGTVVWTSQWGTASVDDASKVKVANGNVDIVGYTGGKLDGETSAGGTSDVYVRRYGASSALQWTEQFGTSQADIANGVVSDADGNVYAVGHTTGAFAGQTNAGAGGSPDKLYDAFLTKLSSTGSVAWTRQFGTAAYDEASAVTLDKSGSIYVVGRTLGAFPGLTNAGGRDILLRQYGSDGSTGWTRMVGTSLDDTPTGAAFLAGRVWISGDTTGTLPAQTNEGSGDAMLISLLPDAP